MTAHRSGDDTASPSDIATEAWGVSGTIDAAAQLIRLGRADETTARELADAGQRIRRAAAGPRAGDTARTRHALDTAASRLSEACALLDGFNTRTISRVCRRRRCQARGRGDAARGHRAGRVPLRGGLDPYGIGDDSAAASARAGGNTAPDDDWRARLDLWLARPSAPLLMDDIGDALAEYDRLRSEVAALRDGMRAAYKAGCTRGENGSDPDGADFDEWFADWGSAAGGAS